MKHSITRLERWCRSSGMKLFHRAYGTMASNPAASAWAAAANDRSQLGLNASGASVCAQPTELSPNTPSLSRLSLNTGLDARTAAERGNVEAVALVSVMPVPSQLRP